MTPPEEEDDVDAGALPPLPPAYEPTRATLHAYAQAVGAIPRGHGIAHPQWWHVSLTVRPDGLVTDPIPLPAGGAVEVRMDIRDHAIVARTSGGDEERLDMASVPTGTEVGDRLIAIMARYGLAADRCDRSRFENDEDRAYEPAAAAAYFEAFVKVAAAFERHRVSLAGPVGPIQVWPHGFDLAFEWFGTKRVDHEGETVPAQLNLGFYPGREPYFYSNPWPFDDALRSAPLPRHAVWHTAGWKGAKLPYDAVQEAPDPAAALAGFARAVFEAAAPALGTHA